MRILSKNKHALFERRPNTVYKAGKPHNQQKSFNSFIQTVGIVHTDIVTVTAETHVRQIYAVMRKPASQRFISPENFCSVRLTNNINVCYSLSVCWANIYRCFIFVIDVLDKTSY